MEIQLADARKILELQLGGYFALRQQYHAEVASQIHGYLSTNESNIDFKLGLIALVALYFTRAGIDAWYSDGNDGEMDDELSSWMQSQQNAEGHYIDALATSLAALKADPKTPMLASQIAVQRADGYTRTLDRIYANAKVAGAKQTMLTFGGFDGNESCADCQMYKGQRHAARWWWAMDAIPPNRNFICGGWRCEHYLHDDKGYLFTF